MVLNCADGGVAAQKLEPGGNKERRITVDGDNQHGGWIFAGSTTSNHGKETFGFNICENIGATK
jgi:hypothetical protein